MAFGGTQPGSSVGVSASLGSGVRSDALLTHSTLGSVLQ